MRTIGTFWTGPRLSDLDHACLRSWLAMGHPVKLYTYDELANVPPGVEVCDGNEVMERRAIFEDAPELATRPFTQANLFRLAMLMKGECVWCDTDFALIRPLPAFTDILLGREQNGKLCNAILWLPADHDLMPTVINSYLRRGMPPWSYGKARWRRFLKRITFQPASLTDYPKHQWGRHALEYYVRRDGLEDQVQDYKAFYYPVIYDNYLWGANPIDHILEDPEVHGLHMFWKKPETFWDVPEESFVGWLRARYGDTIERAPA